VLVRIPIYQSMATDDKVYMYWGAAGDAGYYEDAACHETTSRR
jgi:hypothetical protein